MHAGETRARSLNVPPVFRYTREMTVLLSAGLSGEEDIEVAVVVVVAPGHRATETRR